MAVQPYTPKGAIAAGGYEGYKVLLDQILTFFKTGVAPISKEETIEIFTFMKAFQYEQRAERQNRYHGGGIPKRAERCTEAN